MAKCVDSDETALFEAGLHVAGSAILSQAYQSLVEFYVACNIIRSTRRTMSTCAPHYYVIIYTFYSQRIG